MITCVFFKKAKFRIVVINDKTLRAKVSWTLGTPAPF